MMKWFRRKKKSRNLLTQDSSYVPQRNVPSDYQTSPVPAGLIAKLSPALIEKIFSFVCPHTQDESYENCEQSAVEDTCMLCDLRDLAHCTQVSKRWRKLAANVLYHSIRIDAVHYCELEDILAEKRKRRSKFSRNAEPEDTAPTRLRLICRTLRDDTSGLGAKVQFLKTPYMTRETCKVDLARTVAVLPNLRFVDLPEGFFMDDPSCTVLKQEVQARCPDIRKMTYIGGGEKSLEMLSSGTVWRNLEVLELTRLNMDPTILRQVLGSLAYIKALKITDMKAFDDELFKHSDYLPPFPALTELVFKDTPNLTAEGLASYLFRSDTQDALKTLSLTSTGVHPSTLQRILSTAPSLSNLSIIESVSTSFPASSTIELLASTSLRTLHYEITPISTANSYASTITSYYAYLTSSLLNNGLPNLRALYVRDPDFPESLIDLAPPAPAFASDLDDFRLPRTSTSKSTSALSTKSLPSQQQRFSSNNPFAKMIGGAPGEALGPPPGLKQELEVYSKGLDEMEWNFARVQPAAEPGRRGSMTVPRAVSSYGLGEKMGKSWGGGGGGGARRSIIVGNGFGGFLAVPADDDDDDVTDGRPRSSAGERRSKRRGSRYDMWR